MEKYTLLFYCSSLSLPLMAAGHTKSDSPNVLIIMADQWRADAIGFRGIEPVYTPNVDKLASESIVFTNAVSQFPVSSPARAQFMTGMYPINNKVITNCHSQSAPLGVELPATAECWSDILKSEGYSLGYIGKWHLDAPHAPYLDCSNNKGEMAWNEWCPPNRRHGFDYWMAYGTYDQHMRPLYWNTNDGRTDFSYIDEWGPKYEADKAIAFIQNSGNDYRKEDRPFALVVSMNPPHTAYDQVPEVYKQRYEKLNVDSIAASKPNVPAASNKMGNNFRRVLKDYYACISGVDEQIGRILETLDRSGLSENTIVIVTSDHGDCMGMNEQITKNVIYENSMRIPLIIRYPAKVKARTEPTMLSLMDLYPTMLTLAGFENRIGKQVQAINYAPLILSGKGKYPDSQPYFKYLHTDKLGGSRGIRTERYSYCIHFEEGKPINVQLFDRQTDPFQLNNIAPEADKHLIATLNKQLTEWLLKANDPLAGQIALF